jgi:hypothetical protein
MLIFCRHERLRSLAAATSNIIFKNFRPGAGTFLRSYGKAIEFQWIGRMRNSPRRWLGVRRRGLSPSTKESSFRIPNRVSFRADRLVLLKVSHRLIRGRVLCLANEEAQRCNARDARS